MSINEIPALPFEIDEFYLELQVDGNKIALLPEEVIVAHPFPGLRSYKTSEFQLFKGRDGQGEELINRLEKNHFLAVIGSSGTGKSSLVRASLIPQLLGGYLKGSGTAWNIAICKPGKDPIQNLAAALASLKTKHLKPESLPERFNKIEDHLTRDVYGILEVNEILNEEAPLNNKTNLLVIIDQFEELFRYNRETLNKPNIENDFVNLLLKASANSEAPFPANSEAPFPANSEAPIYVIITMRSEFLGDCVKFRGLPEAINRGQYLVPQLRRNQIKEVIEGPIKLAGKKIDPDLVELLINKLEQKKLKENLDQLPILQHALMSTYRVAVKENADAIINIEHYEKTGGMEKALANHAKAKYNRLGDENSDDDNPSRKQKIAKIVFQALTELGPDLKGGRRPVELKWIYEIAHKMLDTTNSEVDEVVNRFRDNYTSFILPPNNIKLRDDLMLDISHESLMRNWEKLKGWVEDEFYFSKNYERLVESASLYKGNKKDFLSDKELNNLLIWEKDFKPNKIWTQRYDKTFKGKQYDDITFDEAIKYLHDSKRESKKKKRNWYIVLGIFTILLLFSAVYFYYIQFRLNNAFRLNSLAQEQAEFDPTLALRLEERALELQNWRWSLFTQKVSATIIRQASEKIYSEGAFYQTFQYNNGALCYALSPDKNKILIGYIDGHADLIDLNTNKKISFKGHSQKIISVTFSTDASKIITGSADNTAIVWKVSDSSKIAICTGHASSVRSVLFLGDSVLTGSSDGTCKLWNINYGRNIAKEVRTFRKHNCKITSEITSMAISNDHQKLITGYTDNMAILWNLKDSTKTDSLNFGKNGGFVSSVTFSPNSKNFFVGTGGGIGYLFNTDFINQDTVIFQHLGPIWSVAFSPDGKQILTGSEDNTGKLWNTQGILLKELKGHTARIKFLDFTKDGKQYFSGSEDNTLKKWSTKQILEKEIVSINKYNPIFCFSHSLDEKEIITGSLNGDVNLWTINEDILPKKIPLQNNKVINDIALSQDGKKVVMISNRIITLFDTTGQIERQKFWNKGNLTSTAVSPSGNDFIAGSVDSIAILWHINKNSQNKDDSVIFKGHKGAVLCATFFSPILILTGSTDSTARLWNMRGDNITIFKHHDQGIVYSIDFSKDTTTIITGSTNGRIFLWKRNGEFIRYFSVAEGSTITSVQFSEDGKTIYAGSSNGIIINCDLNGENKIAFGAANNGSIKSLSFLPKTKKIISLSVNITNMNIIRFWNPNTIKLDDFFDSKIDRLTNEQTTKFELE